MKKSTLAITAIFALLACVIVAGTTFLDSTANGVITPGAAPVKIVAVDVQGATTNQTVIISRVSNGGAVTNTLVPSITVTNGAVQVEVTGKWIFKDDQIIRTGTATNARVRLVVQQ